jgi:hypothetical protein
MLEVVKNLYKKEAKMRFYDDLSDGTFKFSEG